MNEGIGIIIKKAREEKHLTREGICEGITTVDVLKAIETEQSNENYWLIRELLGRLHIQNSAVIFYLDHKDNEMVNLETEIRRDIVLHRYQEAEQKLDTFYGLCNLKDNLQMLIYYGLYLQLRNQQDIKILDDKILQNFFENHVGYLEQHIALHKLLSLDELLLLMEYYENTIENTIEKMNKFYRMMDYYDSEYAKEKYAHPFYASLKLYYAKYQYEMQEYEGCIRQCEEGLKVSEYFRTCERNAELYELMADAKGRIECQKNDGTKQDRKAIEEKLQAYYCADALYDTFYYGYQDKEKELLQRKMEAWRIMILH